MTPSMKKYDAVIVLGAQIIRESHGRMAPAFHTEMRARAAGIAFKLGVTSALIISGGHNVGVRYSLKDNKVFAEPNLSPFARIRARLHHSEAKIIADFLQKSYGVPRNAMILEEGSRDTQQNARNCLKIVERLDARSTALLTLLYHMERAMTEFQKAGSSVTPLYAEDLLILEDSSWVDRIVEYYSSPRGERQWNPERIRNNLQEGNSIATGFLQV